MNSTGFLTACIVALAGVSASLTPFAERAKNQETKKPGRAWKATGLFCTAFNRITPVPRRADSFESPRYCRSPPSRQQEKSPLNRRVLSPQPVQGKLPRPVQGVVSPNVGALLFTKGIS